MKRIMLILFSVIIFFTACVNQTDNSTEGSTQTQIDPAEEFNGVMFGMTKEEVINTLGQKPDDESQSSMIYRSKTFLNISNATIYYSFSNYGELEIISAYYYYQTNTETEQILNDYSTIKKTLLKNYPPKTHGYFSENDDSLNYSSINRGITLFLYDNMITLDISDTDQTVSNQGANTET